MAAFDLQRQDTIVALATPPGQGALAVVRLSGRRATSIRDACFRPMSGARTGPRLAVRGDVVDDSGGLLDDALVTTFPGPHSYTGEDVVEFSLHGGRVVADVVLAELRRLGARAAAPGEFTLRAVLTGRMGLDEAEAVDAVIGARTERAARVAQRALRGALGSAMTPTRAIVIDVLAELEARLDYPDEPLGEANRLALVDRLGEAIAALETHLSRAATGRRLVEGARVVLWGAPNAGKSTLLNALHGSERALVHDEPGTTRDVLEVPIAVDGIPLVVVDVAGIRAGGEVGAVEQAGIARATEEARRADVVLVLAPVDGPPAPPLPDDVVADAVVAVTTKCDLVAADQGPVDDGALRVSAKTGVGVDDLRARLAAVLGDDGATPLVQTARQTALLESAHAALAEALGALVASTPDEIVCSELRRAARHLDSLTGADVGEDVLSAIFSRFCVGK